MQCPSCGTTLPSTAKFCGSCGHQFEAAPSSPAGLGSVDDVPGQARASSQALVPIEELVNNPPAFPSTKDVLAEAWELTKPDIGKWAAGTLVLGLAMVVLACTIIGTLAIGPLGAGFFIVALRVVQGRDFQIGNFFDGVKLFLPLFLLGIVQGVGINIGMYLLILPGLYLSIAWMFAQSLVIDRGLDFWPALETSRKVMHQNLGPAFVFLLAIGGLNILGAIPCYLGLFVTMPMSVIAMALVYKKMFGIAGGAERLGG